MEIMKELKEAFGFVSSSEFWRMSILWTFSLIVSYFHLFFQNIFANKNKNKNKNKPNFYPRSSRKPTSSNPTIPASVKRPICIITGATSGLGAAAAYELAKEGFYVVLVGRSSHLLSERMSDIKKHKNDALVKAFEVDLSCFKSILKFKNYLQQWLLDSNMHPSVQLLINNAGIFATSSRLTIEGYDEMMATNYIGAFCLTKVLLTLMENSPVPSRIVNVTSFTHRSVFSAQVDRGAIISGNSSSISESYPCAHIYEYSKLCLLLFSYELHRQLALMQKSQAVSVIAVDPGAVKTNIMREIPRCLSLTALFVLKLLGLLQSPEKGVCSIIDAALASPDPHDHNTIEQNYLCGTMSKEKIEHKSYPEISGVHFFGGSGRTINSSTLSYDRKLSKDLWAASNDIFLELQLASNDEYTR